MGQLAQPHRVRQLRREVAQLNTVRGEQSRAGRVAQAQSAAGDTQ